MSPGGFDTTSAVGVKIIVKITVKITAEITVEITVEMWLGVSWRFRYNGDGGRC